jgi:hypothetical protein
MAAFRRGHEKQWQNRTIAAFGAQQPQGGEDGRPTSRLK